MSLNRGEVPNYPNYLISDCGRIFKKEGWVKRGALPDVWEPEREFKPRLDRYGYPGIHLTNDAGRKFITIHRLVASVFVPGESKENNVINHIDGNKCNNHFTNLEWTTTLENNRHKWQMKKLNRGLKYSDEQIQDILTELLTKPRSLAEISRDLSVSISVVSNVASGKSHRHLYEQRGGDEVFKKIHSYILSIPSPRPSKYKYEVEGKKYVSHPEIALDLGLCRDTVRLRINSTLDKFKEWRRL